MFLRRLAKNIYRYYMGKNFLHLSYRHSQVPEGVPEGLRNKNLGRNSQEHPVVFRNYFWDSLRDFFRDFSGTSQEHQMNQNALLLLFPFRYYTQVLYRRIGQPSILIREILTVAALMKKEILAGFYLLSVGNTDGQEVKIS